MRALIQVCNSLNAFTASMGCTTISTIFSITCRFGLLLALSLQYISEGKIFNSIEDVKNYLDQFLQENIRNFIIIESCYCDDNNNYIKMENI